MSEIHGPGSAGIDRPVNREAEADVKAEAERQRQLSNRRALQKHEIAIAKLDEEKTSVRHARRVLRADRREARRLDRLNRRAKVTGARVRITHDLKNTGEIKAIRLQNVRVASLSVFVPVLLAFAAWSTVGVHKGVDSLVGDSPVSWGVEPALIAVVAGIIIIRSILRTANGDLDWRAYAIEFTALTASIALNLAGAWPAGGFTLGTAGAHAAALIAHSIGPVGAAGTAILISVIDDGISDAKPYEGSENVSDPAVYVETELRPLSQTEVSLSRGTDLGQLGTPALSQPKVRVSRPKVVPAERPTVSHENLGQLSHGTETVSHEDLGQLSHGTETVSHENLGQLSHGTELVPVSQPKVSQSDQFERVVAAWETARDKGESTSVRTIALTTGVPKSTVDRILKPYRTKTEA